MKYKKDPKTIQQQIELLKERGLSFNNEKEAESILSSVSYYRLSAYFLTFQHKDGTHAFKPNATFNYAYNTYLFDGELRHILFNAIETIEIALKARMINLLSIEYGSLWYINNIYFFNKEWHADCLEIIKKDINNSKEVFIEHYRSKYSDPEMPPAWIALEVVSLGTISKMYKNLLKGKIKTEIAKSFGLPVDVFSSWIETLAYVRNLCAHHSRVWNRILVKKPILPNRVKNKWVTLPFQMKTVDDTNENEHLKIRIYPVLCLIQYLIRTIDNKNSIFNEMKSCLTMYPTVPISYMGFPDNWVEDDFWK
ncbi:MAG TPA: Abi family protein [Spirochaetota bacterium]|nr:Abi family protein [Spirochaetota bacterium]